MAKKMKQISKTPQQNKKNVEAKSVKTEPIIKLKKLQRDEFDHEFEKTLKERKNKKPKVEIEEEENEEDEVESDVDSGDEDLDDEDSNDEGDEDDDDEEDEDDDEFGSDDDESTDEEEDETEMPAKKFKKVNGKVDVEKEVKNTKAEGKKENKKEKKDIPQPSKILKSSDPDIKKANINFEERNERSLYVKMLPTDWTENDIKKLHPTIQIVRMVRNKMRSKPLSRRSCFLEFASAAVMEQALVKIRDEVGKFKGGVVDYAGKNSEYMQNKKNKVVLYTPLKLFVTGFELDTTTYNEILKMFPKATTIVGDFTGDVTSPKITRKLATESCVVCFKLEKDCKEALSFKLTTKSGAKLLIQFSRANKVQMRNTLKRMKKTASKKRKRAEKKEGSVKASETTPKKPPTQGKNKSTPKAKQTDTQTPKSKETPKTKETPKKQNGQTPPSQEKKSAKKNKKVTPSKSPVLKSPPPVSGQKRKAPENNKALKKAKN